jgi:hypothetical protein
MLRLSDSELDIVWSAARPLAVEDRDAFLQEVAERLAAMPERGDGSVFRICAEVQRKHFDPPIGEPGPPPRKLRSVRQHCRTETVEQQPRKAAG